MLYFVHNSSYCVLLFQFQTSNNFNNLIHCLWLTLKFLFADLIEDLFLLQKKYGGFFRIWLGSKLLYFVCKPEHCEKILKHPKAMAKDYMYKFINNVTGEGLMTAKGLFTCIYGVFRLRCGNFHVKNLFFRWKYLLKNNVMVVVNCNMSSTLIITKKFE